MNLVIKKPEGIVMEYASKGVISVIYNLGVLLLEILSGKRNASFLNLTGNCLLQCPDIEHPGVS